MARISKKKITAAVASLALIGGGVAFAFWTSGGSDTGTATVGTSADWVVAITDTEGDDLSPNGPTQTVTFTVTNIDTGVKRITGNTAEVVDTDEAGCTATNFMITDLTNLSGHNVDPGDTATGTFKLQMIDTGVDQNACKNATVNLKVDVS